MNCQRRLEVGEVSRAIFDTPDHSRRHPRFHSLDTPRFWIAIVLLGAFAIIFAWRGDGVGYRPWPSPATIRASSHETAPRRRARAVLMAAGYESSCDSRFRHSYGCDLRMRSRLLNPPSLSRLSEQLLGSESAIPGAPDASTERIRLAVRSTISHGRPAASGCWRFTATTVRRVFVAWYGTEEDADTETVDVEKCGLCVATASRKTTPRTAPCD